MTRWSVLYRGPLSSCNYACDYCPFAKTTNTAAELRDDADRLSHFVAWVQGQDRAIGVQFTPWGEALIRRPYQRAMVALSHSPNVWSVAIQTNLSAPIEWLAEANRQVAGLWATWHPTQVSLDRFVAKCLRLRVMGVRFSVGVVGLLEQLAPIEALRARLPPDVYVWVNAYKRERDYYSPADVARLLAVDPHFGTNNQRHPSAGESCRAGATSFTVDGSGDVRRCHFVGGVLGNIYRDDVAGVLGERPCPNATCGCHIGYVHLDRLGQYSLYGDGLLTRIRA